MLQIYSSGGGCARLVSTMQLGIRFPSSSFEISATLVAALKSTYASGLLSGAMVRDTLTVALQGLG